MKYLKEEIADSAILSLIEKYLAAGHMNPKTQKVEKSQVGIPQGGVLSPILCNIVLHKFDIYMENYIQKFEKGLRRRHNPEYQRLQHLHKKATTKEEKRKYLLLKRRVSTGDPVDPNFKRMMYVRYAYDFIILIIGSKNDAKLCKMHIKDALARQCGAELSEEKTLISHMYEGFKFLGAYIRKLAKSDFLGDMGNGKQRVMTRRLLINAPMPDLIEKMVKGNIARRNHLGTVLPKGIPKMNNLTHYDILR
jgi:retron-type reverse transcriptase